MLAYVNSLLEIADVTQAMGPVTADNEGKDTAPKSQGRLLLLQRSTLRYVMRRCLIKNAANTV
jgi:hypothetical protein